MFLFCLALGIAPVYGTENLSVDLGDKQAQLTETQKEEIATLYKEIFQKKKEVVGKYVEYGIITKEKGDKIISRLDRIYEKLVQNNFIPQKFIHKKGYH